MSLAEFAVTLDEFSSAINIFIAKECKKKDNQYTHKNCGSAIRTGFLDLFYLNEDSSLNPGSDGFGIGPKRVPYCESCFPPDGFNHTYAVRFPILRERETELHSDSKFVWGNRELTVGNQGLLLR